MSLSINNLQNPFTLTIDGLNSLDTDSLYVGGIPVQPSGYIPYVGASSTINLGNNEIFTSFIPITSSDLTNKTYVDSNISTVVWSSINNLAVLVDQNFLKLNTLPQQNVSSVVSFSTNINVGSSIIAKNVNYSSLIGSTISTNSLFASNEVYLQVPPTGGVFIGEENGIGKNNLRLFNSGTTSFIDFNSTLMIRYGKDGAPIYQQISKGSTIINNNLYPLANNHSSLGMPTNSWLNTYSQNIFCSSLTTSSINIESFITSTLTVSTATISSLLASTIINQSSITQTALISTISSNTIASGIVTANFISSISSNFRLGTISSLSTNGISADFAIISTVQANNGNVNSTLAVSTISTSNLQANGEIFLKVPATSGVYIGEQNGTGNNNIRLFNSGTTSFIDFNSTLSFRYGATGNPTYMQISNGSTIVNNNMYPVNSNVSSLGLVSNRWLNTYSQNVNCSSLITSSCITIQAIISSVLLSSISSGIILAGTLRSALLSTTTISTSNVNTGFLSSISSNIRLGTISSLNTNQISTSNINSGFVSCISSNFSLASISSLNSNSISTSIINSGFVSSISSYILSGTISSFNTNNVSTLNVFSDFVSSVTSNTGSANITTLNVTTLSTGTLSLVSLNTSSITASTLYTSSAVNLSNSSLITSQFTSSFGGAYNNVSSCSMTTSSIYNVMTVSGSVGTAIIKFDNAFTPNTTYTINFTWLTNLFKIYSFAWYQMDNSLASAFYATGSGPAFGSASATVTPTTSSLQFYVGYALIAGDKLYWQNSDLSYTVNQTYINRLGINTINPAYSLDVNGVGRFSTLLASTIGINVTPEYTFDCNGYGNFRGGQVDLGGGLTNPIGLNTEASNQIVNLNWNFRSNISTVNTANVGIDFRLDSRGGGISPFQWLYRPAGSSSETGIADLSNVGLLTLSTGINTQTGTFTSGITVVSSCFFSTTGSEGLYIGSASGIGGNNIRLFTATTSAFFDFQSTLAFRHGASGLNLLELSNYQYYFRGGVDGSIACGTADHRWSEVWALNGTIQTSDSRLKDFKPLSYGLNEISKISTIQYQWKSQQLLPDSDPKKNFQYYGFCADQISSILPELVYYEYPSTSMQMNYTEILPVVVNAVKELNQQSLMNFSTVETSLSQTINLVNSHESTVTGQQNLISTLNGNQEVLILHLGQLTQAFNNFVSPI